MNACLYSFTGDTAIVFNGEEIVFADERCDGECADCSPGGGDPLAALIAMEEDEEASLDLESLDSLGHPMFLGDHTDGPGIEIDEPVAPVDLTAAQARAERRVIRCAEMRLRVTHRESHHAKRKLARQARVTIRRSA